jgi:hypothetical protein
LFGSILMTALMVSVRMLRSLPVGGLSMGQVFNFAEGWLWVVIALVLVACAERRGHPHQGLACAAAVGFFAFGISDFVEFYTGAWYRPWTLFLFKALCVGGLLLVLRQYSMAGRHK